MYIIYILIIDIDYLSYLLDLYDYRIPYFGILVALTDCLQLMYQLMEVVVDHQIHLYSKIIELIINITIYQNRKNQVYTNINNLIGFS